MEQLIGWAQLYSQFCSMAYDWHLPRRLHAVIPREKGVCSRQAAKVQVHVGSPHCQRGHNAVCALTNLSCLELCVGACSWTSSNLLQKDQCNTIEHSSPAPGPFSADSFCANVLEQVPNHRLRKRRHFWGRAGGGGGRGGQKKKCRRRMFPPRGLACYAGLSQTAPAL